MIPTREQIERLEEAMAAIAAQIGELGGLNAGPPLRSRSLSVATTNFETGVLWLEDAIRGAKERLEEQEEAAA